MDNELIEIDILYIDNELIEIDNELIERQKERQILRKCNRKIDSNGTKLDRQIDR